MIMFITRHGQTDWNLEKRLQGRNDIPLNQKGKAQADCCGRALGQAGIELIIASPLCRAAETGRIISKWLGDVPVIYDERLLERDFGLMNGKIADERDADSWPPEIGVESKASVAARLRNAMEDYRRKYPEKTILVVTHGAALYSLLNQVLEEKLTLRPAQLKNGGINCIVYEDSPKLSLFNISPEEYGESMKRSKDRE